MTEMSPTKTYWPQLEGLRGVAILMIMAMHFWHTFASGMLPLPQPLVEFVGSWIYNLASGVRLFFALSGFLIYGHLLDQGELRWPDLAAFYRRRSRRILPAFLFFLALYLGFTSIYGATGQGTPLTPLNLFGAITFLSPAIRLLRPDLIPSLEIIPGTWSLNPEVWFYALVPAALILCSGKRWPFLVLLLMVSPLWRAAMPADVPFAVRFDLFAMSDSFVWGMVAARLQRSYPHPIAAKVAIAVGSALFIAMCAPIGVMDLARASEVATDLASALLIYGVTVSNGVSTAFLRNKALVHFGRISYSLFLCHITIAWYVVWPIVEVMEIGSPLPRFLFACGMSLAISHWISVSTYTHVELPGLGRTPFRPTNAFAAAMVLAVTLVSPTAILSLPRGYSVELLARDERPGYSRSDGRDGWLMASGFPEKLKLDELNFGPPPRWTAVFFPLQQQALAQSAGWPVLISAHVQARGSGYRVCLGIYDGQKDQCSTVIPAGTERLLTLSGRIIDPSRFQAKINIFPTEETMNIDLTVTDISVTTKQPQ